MNIGTSTWTLDPNGSELINGKTTLTLGIGEEMDIYCDGTAFYTNASRGKLVELWRQTASSSATIDFDFAGGFPADFDEFEVHVVKIKGSTDDRNLELQVKTTASLTVQTTGYAYGGHIQGPGGGADTGSTIDSFSGAILIGRTGAGSALGNDTGEFISGKLSFTKPNSADYPVFRFDGVFVTSSEIANNLTVTGYYSTPVALTGMRFLVSSGNIVSGDFVLYGIRK